MTIMVAESFSIQHCLGVSDVENNQMCSSSPSLQSNPKVIVSLLPPQCQAGNEMFSASFCALKSWIVVSLIYPLSSFFFCFCYTSRAFIGIIEGLRSFIPSALATSS